MAKTCTEINEWIEEEVSRPIEEWEERREKKCKERHWYDPRGWFCWFVTYLTKVIRWVLVKVGKWVVRTVCRVVSSALTFIVNVLYGLGNMLAGIFTWNGHRVWDGFVQLIAGAVEFVFVIVGVVLLGDTVTYIIEEIDKYRLRNYVRTLLEAKYSGDNLEKIKEALHLDHGVFGLRMTADAVRTFLNSEEPSDTESGVPQLIILHESKAIDLKVLCGFDYNQGFWNRKRYKTLKKGIIVTGGGLGSDEPDNPISEDELNEYISSRGARGPKFFILPLSLTDLDTKLNTGEDKGRELGLILTWNRKTKLVRQAGEIVHPETSSHLVSFLIATIERTSTQDNANTAEEELCHPVVVAIFQYEGSSTLRGISACLKGSKCQRSHLASGATFIDNTPDIVWKYVPIHEFGHLFGLCHVDGIDRVMYSPKENSWFTWKTLFNLLYFRQEAKFVLDEAKQAWDYIVANFHAECLGGIDESEPVRIE